MGGFNRKEKRAVEGVGVLAGFEGVEVCGVGTGAASAEFSIAV
jgi:hypothetical protein